MLNRVQWEARFSVGNSELDSQHRRLLAQCNALADCIEDRSRDGDQQFHNILNELALYVREHFVTEETLLAARHYPALNAQRCEHDAFESRMAEVMISACEGNFDKFGLHAFLSAWWVDHILGSDMKYRDFLL